MNIRFTFKQLDSSDALKHFTTEKSEPLKHYFDGKLNLTWTFSGEHGMFIAHCHLVGNHMDYFAEAETDNIHASVEKVVDKLETQLRKHKEIVTRH